MASVSSGDENDIDPVYPGTAVQRLRNVHKRVRSLTQEQLDEDWSSVRRTILWAGGLKDLPDASPGRGYTGVDYCMNCFWYFLVPRYIDKFY